MPDVEEEDRRRRIYKRAAAASAILLIIVIVVGPPTGGGSTGTTGAAAPTTSTPVAVITDGPTATPAEIFGGPESATPGGTVEASSPSPTPVTETPLPTVATTPAETATPPATAVAIDYTDLFEQTLAASDGGLTTPNVTSRTDGGTTVVEVAYKSNATDPPTFQEMAQVGAVYGAFTTDGWETAHLEATVYADPDHTEAVATYRIESDLAADWDTGAINDTTFLTRVNDTVAPAE